MRCGIKHGSIYVPFDVRRTSKYKLSFHNDFRKRTHKPNETMRMEEQHALLGRPCQTACELIRSLEVSFSIEQTMYVCVCVYVSIHI